MSPLFVFTGVSGVSRLSYTDQHLKNPVPCVALPLICWVLLTKFHELGMRAGCELHKAGRDTRLDRFCNLSREEGGVCIL